MVSNVNVYEIMIKFTDGAKLTTYVYSDDEIKDFATEFNEKFQDKRNNYVNFTGEEPFTMVNKDNIVLYTIKLAHIGVIRGDE